MLFWLYNKMEFFVSHLELLFVPITWLLCCFIGIMESSIYAVLGLVLLFLLAGCMFIFYFKLSFLGVLLIMIYMGALAVLFLFIVMMMPVEEEVKRVKIKNIFFYFLFFMFFLIMILWLFAGFMFTSIDYINYEMFDEIVSNYDLVDGHQNTGNFKESTWRGMINNDIVMIGKVLYGKLSLPLILCSLLLFYALMMAIIFSQDK